MSQMNDAPLKKAVQEVLERCRLDKVVIDREVHINFSGAKDGGNLADEKEFDVVAKFQYAGRRVLMVFECENSGGSDGIKTLYRGYAGDIKEVKKNLSSITVLTSKDSQISGHHFHDVDDIRVCFVYGEKLPETKYRSYIAEAAKHSFLAWNQDAVTYYQTMSGVLGKLTRYELFKDFDLDLDSGALQSIPAIEVAQKNRRMYFGAIHPGLLLKVAYVVRRAYERTHAYQRMLNGDRIQTISHFISSTKPDAFIANAVIVVMDDSAEYQSRVKYDQGAKSLTFPFRYASLWMIDGQHRAYGFLNTPYEQWTPDSHEPFDLPIIVFRELPEALQTKTFVNINYFQKRIKANLLCDLATVTKDLQQKLTWASLLGRGLNESHGSPLHNRVKTSELQYARPIGLSSLVQYGLLETLLGFRQKDGAYTGPLFTYAPFDPTKSFASSDNSRAFAKQLQLLIRFLRGLNRNTRAEDSSTDPWRNWNDYALIKPTGLNAAFMLLAKILQVHPTAALDFDVYLKPLRRVSFRSARVAKKGGGWKGFRGLANTMIGRLNAGKRKGKLARFGKKAKV